MKSKQVGQSKSKSGSLSKSKQHDAGTRKVELDRITAMLSRLGGRGYRVQEDVEPYGQAEFDSDPDPDFDPDFDLDPDEISSGDS